MQPYSSAKGKRNESLVGSPVVVPIFVILMVVAFATYQAL